MIGTKKSNRAGTAGGTAMKHTIILAVGICLSLGLVWPADAHAGWFDKWKNKDQKEKLVPRYDLLPTMTFYKGVLGYGVGHSWQLDDLELHFVRDCVVTSEMNEGDGLQAGREALVMGSRFGNVIIAHRVRMVKPDYMNEGMSNSATVTPCEVDKTVGIGSGPE